MITNSSKPGNSETFMKIHTRFFGRRALRRVRCLVVLAHLIFITLTLSAQQFQVPWFSIDGGGGTSSGGDYSVSGTIGQPDAGFSSGGNYTLEGGFWAIESIGLPELHISYALATTVRIWWPSPSAGFVLQVNTSVNNPGGWANVGGAVTDDGTIRSVTASSVDSLRFYRLHKN
jgi:hypothetical protein